MSVRPIFSSEMTSENASGDASQGKSCRKRPSQIPDFFFFFLIERVRGGTGDPVLSGLLLYLKTIGSKYRFLTPKVISKRPMCLFVTICFQSLSPKLYVIRWCSRKWYTLRCIWQLSQQVCHFLCAHIYAIVLHVIIELLLKTNFPPFLFFKSMDII